MSAILEVADLSVARDGRTLLEHVDLRVETGSTLALIGPSGSGKTTLLRAIAGLDAPTRGRITIAGRLVTVDSRIIVPPEHRGVAMVFQDLGLWPHMSVEQHLQFALAAQGSPKHERATRCADMLQTVGLTGRERQRPATLSGGERQRLAIARALVAHPSMVLFDEPFSNLDIVLKRDLIDLLAGLLRDTQSTAIFVTHEPRDAVPLSKRLAVLEHGRIQCGDLTEIVGSAATPFTRELATSLAAFR